jgi:alpha-L-arabinofuranosidase
MEMYPVRQETMVSSVIAAMLMVPSPGTGTIEIDATKLGAKIDRNLFYGVFLEEINNSGEGGLYAELIQNRGFEDSNVPPACTVRDGFLYAPQNPSFWEMRSKDFRTPWPYRTEMPAWTLEGTGTTVRLTKSKPLSEASASAVEMKVAQPGAKFVNSGFWGMNFVDGEKYNLSFFTSNQSYQGGFDAVLLSESGAELGRVSIPSVIGSDWKQHKVSITASGSDPKGRFALVPTGKGSVLVDFVSLFPAKTWKNKPNGLRPDLAQLIADLKPRFIRWPGGCVVEGITIETRPRWEETIGPLHERVPTYIPWGYWVSNGFGYHEWLELCEEMNAEPLYVFNVGVSCAFRSGTFLSDEELPALIQNTLDAIEYAIGPTTSKWGAMRAKNGHPKPFKMTMVEIGNEQQGPRYGARVKLFTEAIKRKYPQLKVALSSWIAGIDQGAINAAGPQLDIVDEHAYKPVNWAVQNFDSFGKYPRDVKWELYIGEFATNAGVGRGNMLATIGDAAYMMSMEKNGDLVKMGSYAPLLENTNRRQWEVNLIHFDSSRAYGRASYYACKIFAENLPDVNFPTSVNFSPAGEAPIAGPIGLGTYSTEAEFKEIKVTQGGITKDLNDFTKWQPRSGRWIVRDGAYVQTQGGHDRWTYFGEGYQDATVTLKARKVSGEEGFVVSVGNADGRRVHFNVGGWANRQHGLEAGGPVKQARGSVETGRWYDVRIQTIGRRVICSLDDKVIFDETLPRVDTVLATSGREERTGDVLVKVLNTGSNAANVSLNLRGLTPKTGTISTLNSDDPLAENSYSAMTRIVPKSASLSLNGSLIRHTFPPYSVSILRLNTR